MKSLIKKFIPQKWLVFYHKSLAVLANQIYGKPSEKLIVIGVTGTNGKTTTCKLISNVLEEAGYKTGITSTAVFKIAEKEWLNNTKMTMPGRFALQKMMAQMVKAGCKYAIIETSSQGVVQFRHIGIHYDVVVFTNLTPEHIEAHGGFDNYKKAKLKLFEKLQNDPVKIIDGKKIEKAMAVNIDDDSAQSFLNFKIEKKIAFGIDNPDANLNAKNLIYNSNGITFEIDQKQISLKLYGKFNVYNSLSAIAVASSQNINLEVCKSALEKITEMPGRMELIESKNFAPNTDFKIIVDYAPEPESLGQSYGTIKNHNMAPGRIIHVLGSCGGGRDIARRPILGSMVARNAQIAIITNEDPYDDDPAVIIEQVAQGAISGGMVLGQNLFKIEDREKAIEKALFLAQPGDLVFLTGKGCEQAICVANGKKIPWDERKVVHNLLAKLGK
ncbi:MAG: UDP-N-acetylmuramoyl-L-alanyl-D-glutamate--2,6-diaminopimelate ligase [Candidatus Buchananbacteria bacterium]